MNLLCTNCGATGSPGSAFCQRCGASVATTQQQATPGAPRHITATSAWVGRTCPYCRFPIKEGGPVVECGVCHAVQHADCFRENGGCSVAACAGGPSPETRVTTAMPAAGTPLATVSEPMHAQPAPGTQIPPPPPGMSLPPPVRPGGGGRRPIAAIATVATVLVLLLGGGATALVVSGNSESQTASTGSDSTNSAGQPCNNDPASPLPLCDNTNTSTDTSVQPPPATTDTTTSTSTTATASDVTGQDANGFNTGPNCSDNPSSSLPGCSDSPSTPNGDPEGSCPNGITVDQQTTTCGLAENVYSSYTSDGQVMATSPKTGQSFTFTCQTAGTGTTGYTICHAQDGASTLYLRWHQ